MADINETLSSLVQLQAYMMVRTFADMASEQSLPSSWIVERLRMTADHIQSDRLLDPQVGTAFQTNLRCYADQIEARPREAGPMFTVIDGGKDG